MKDDDSDVRGPYQCGLREMAEAKVHWQCYSIIQMQIMTGRQGKFCSFVVLSDILFDPRLFLPASYQLIPPQSQYSIKGLVSSHSSHQ